MSGPVAIPPEAVQAAAEAMCDLNHGLGSFAECEDASKHRDDASEALRAAEAVWPHTGTADQP